MNFDSLKDDILSMIAGESVPVNTGSFINDMTTFRTEDDVLTLVDDELPDVVPFVVPLVVPSVEEDDIFSIVDVSNPTV